MLDQHYGGVWSNVISKCYNVGCQKSKKKTVTLEWPLSIKLGCALFICHCCQYLQYLSITFFYFAMGTVRCAIMNHACTM